MSKQSFKLLQKNTCIHKENKCNHLLPFSLMELYGKDNFTTEEKNENLKKYKMSCKNQAGQYTSCCDKNDKNLEKVLKKMKLPKLKGKVEYDRYGKLHKVELCEDEKKCKDSKKLSAYEMCKIGENNLDNTKSKKIIQSFNPDCFMAQCNPQEKVPNILGTINENYSYEMDKNMSLAIKNNDLSMIKYYIQKDPSLKKRVLTHNQEGNSIYHESLKFNSGNNIYYLFKLASKEIAFNQNLMGDTILHMSMCIDIPNAIMFSLKIGCDINEKNNLGETPIYCAIRNNLINNVRMAINNIASLDTKNKKGDTPLLIALKLKTKNVDIIRLLVERGSDINTLDKDSKNSLKIINDIKNPIQEDEEVRTYLEQVTLQNMGVKLGEKKTFTSDETRKFKNIIYNLDNQELLNGNKTKFKIDIDYTSDTENYYPDDLSENYMQPFKPGDKNLSHEPYFQKFKDLQKDKLEILKKTIMLTKWDNKNNKKKKLEIIDEIMEGKHSFDSYKYEVLNDNGITIEQEHNIFKDFSPTPAESVTLMVEGKNQEPYNIKTNEYIPPYYSNPPSPIEKKTYPPTYTPAESIELNRNIFKVFNEYVKENSTIFLFLSIIITIGIIFYLYTKKN